MFDPATLQDLVQSYGLWLLVPLSILEGPIVTVLAAWFAHANGGSLTLVYTICVIGDLAGDTLIYGLGRGGPGMLPDRWQRLLRIDVARRDRLTDHFAVKGGRTLLIGKLTHSAGFAVLLAAGAARMPLGKFWLYNLLGSLPKTLCFVLVGVLLGNALPQVDRYIAHGSLILLGLMALAALVWWCLPRRCSS
ncbi:DedA family protein [Phaeovulum sp. W22_SRMD_FR3]|uniref:DedA family protein n=1 Tax=Phaeovulum sp. W22_SRMD_FR3 TaxID=3240274 RepID=UPI003F9B6249